MRKVLAFTAAVMAAFLLAACGPTTTASTPQMTSAPTSPAPCVDPEHDGDCH